MIMLEKYFLKYEKIWIFVLLFLLITNIYFWSIIINYFSSPVSEVIFFSVGQGDAALIKTRAGNVLIDAGPGAQILHQLGKVLPFYERTIDLFILSNPSRDHFRGFFDVLSRYQVRGVVLTDWIADGSEYQTLLEKIRQKNVMFIRGERGNRIRFDEKRKIDIIYPDIIDVKRARNVNEASIVLNFTDGYNNFLFTGDIGKTTERRLLPFLTPTTVLKVAHHGSKHSSSQEFLEIIRPLYAIISVGRNRYGHPNRETKERLINIGANIFRTDLDGIIRFWQTINNEFFFQKIEI